MTQEDLSQQTHRALLMFIAQAKVQNESYTHFLGMFRHSDKQKFNNLIVASESFCKTIKHNLPQESIDAVDRLEEYFQDFMFSLIKNGDFTISPNRLLKKKLNQMLDAEGCLEYDSYSLRHVIKMLEKEDEISAQNSVEETEKA